MRYCPGSAPGKLSATPLGCGSAALRCSRAARMVAGKGATRAMSTVSSPSSMAFPLDLTSICSGVDAVGAALENGELARAQIATLLLRLPDPPGAEATAVDVLEKRSLRARPHCLRATEGRTPKWDDKHPRTGAPRESGASSAPTSGEPDTEGPNAGSSSTAGASSRGGAAPAFLPAVPIAGTRFVARRRLVSDRLARAGDVGRPRVGRDDLVQCDLRAKQQSARRRGPHPRPSRHRLSLGTR